MNDSDYQILKNSWPKLPGVYRFIDQDDTILYIGKAKVLRKRLMSYFTNKKNQAFKTSVMVKNAHHIEYTIVETEQDALLLESSLIKKFQPRYNVMLKDGKTYSYICIKKEPFPRVFFSRKLIRDGSQYFGPYTSKFRVRILLELIRELFQLRTCTLPLTASNIEADKFKVCLEYHIKNCGAPCVGYESEEKYNEKIDQIKNILSGKLSLVKRYLVEKMQEHADRLEFEMAQQLKEKLVAFEAYQSKSLVASTTLRDIDVFSIEDEDQVSYVNYLKIIDGALVNTDTIELTKNLDQEPEDILVYAIQTLREKFNSMAPELIVPFKIRWIEPEVKITVPQRGEKHQLLKLSEKNVKYFSLQLKKKRASQVNKQHASERILKVIQADLQMDKVPFHIECFDNSNLQGTNPVASCVVFKNGKPAPKEYRKFNIKTVVGPDDFASMKEVVRRRYTRLLKEKQSLPDLVIIDGGKGQLSAAYAILKELELTTKIQLIGIAKKLEEIFFPEDPVPLYINKKSETLKVIQHARNEAHRFAITFHRNQRSKNFLDSELLLIPGIGNKTAEKLLSFYGSIQKVKEQSLASLTTVVPVAMAKKVFFYFKKQDME